MVAFERDSEHGGQPEVQGGRASNTATQRGGDSMYGSGQTAGKPPVEETARHIAHAAHASASPHLDVARQPESASEPAASSHAARTHEQIVDEIRRRLAGRPDIDVAAIEIVIGSGEVNLSGTVANREAKRFAEEVAFEVSGTADVQNRLRLTPNGGETDAPAKPR